jgi:hypothetical protein
MLAYSNAKKLQHNREVFEEQISIIREYANDYFGKSLMLEKIKKNPLNFKEIDDAMANLDTWLKYNKYFADI